MNPKISIITPCYNSEKHIEECILSVINQDYDNIEYIIVDGGSTDNTLNIINKYKDRIAYVISESDNGISDAFNKGLRVATGDLIGIINSDDFMMPNVLRRLALEYEDGVDVYRGYQILYYPTRKKFKTEFPNNRFGRIPIGNCICHEAAFITKEMYMKVGFYRTDLKYLMDLDLFMRLKRMKAKHKFINLCVLTFRIGGASSSINRLYLNERYRLVKENNGSCFEAFVYKTYHAIKQWIKLLVFKIWPK